jgi:hypothetical protein
MGATSQAVQVPAAPVPWQQEVPLMMMAYDSSPGRNTLTEQTIDEVRTALVGYVQSPTSGERLGLALRDMAAEARDRSMLPEQLLVVLKDIWYALPAVRGLKEPADQVRLLQRVVTICIKEYYAE